ncbi:MAG: PEP-CTERM sorting domain-containing protein [Planctomycetia bacterium]|nr:PEP-CTERM sorting domain-containing protein [Planctomycetia bacterium]
MLSRFRFLVLVPLLACVWADAAPAGEENEILVADRLTNRVLRYGGSDGSLIGVLVDDPINLDEPNGMALSPDKSKLYVASRQNSSIVRYDYNGFEVANPTVLVTEGLTTPSSILLEPGDSKFYVSNLGGAAFDGATVGQFNADGSSAGAELTGGLPAGRTGLAFAPNGDLLVSSFGTGEILRYNEATSSFETFIGPDQALLGAGNLIVDANSLYVAAGFTGAVMKFNATTGAPDPTFAPISGLVFPASLALLPNDGGLLVGSLGFVDGTGRIDKYSLSGEFIETFADNSAADPALGFVEATGLLSVNSFLEVFQVGDTDEDGDVDITDLNGVRNNFGEQGATDGSLVGDAFPYDGVVNVDDLNGVRNNFGVSPPGGSAVPEPSTAILALAGCVVCGLVKRRRR